MHIFFSHWVHVNQRLVYLAVLLFTGITFASSSAQSTITWEQATASANTSDIRALSSNNAEVLYAFNGGGDLSIGGIDFEGGTLNNNGLPDGVSISPSSPASTADAGVTENSGDSQYDTLLDRFAFTTSGTQSAVMQLSGLTVGTEYQIQVWFCDQRNTGVDRSLIFGDNGQSSSTVSVAAGTGNFGENAVGSFTATAQTQQLSLQTSGFANLHLNAFVLSTVVEINQDPLEPIDGPNLIIDSSEEWAAAIDNGNSAFSVADGSATSLTNNSVFQSRVQSFTTKQTFEKLVIHQSKEWTINKWGQPSVVDPELYDDDDVGPALGGDGDVDAPVFLLVQDGDYWVFDRQNGGGRAFHAYHSTDMENWEDKGIIGNGFDWVTTAEFRNNTMFVYHDRPNDHDPSVVTFPYVPGSSQVFDTNGNEINGTNPSTINNRQIAVNDHGVILDKPEVTIGGETFSLAGGSDNCVFRDPSDGQFHIIHENWSRQNAQRFSFDSNIASQAISSDGIEGFVFDEGTRPVDMPGNLLPASAGNASNGGNVETRTLDGIVYHIGAHPNRRHLFRLSDQLHAWGDWSMIKVGDTYYLFCDDDSEEEGIGLGYWFGNSLDEPFTYGGRLLDGLHPDPGVGFGEGNFLLMLQQNDNDGIYGNDLLSHGPWVQGIEAQAGVDIDGDGEIDEWSEWQDITESYFQLEGYSKAFGVEEATLDTSSLPAGFGVAFRMRSASGGVVFDSVEITTAAAVAPEPVEIAVSQGATQRSMLIDIDVTFTGDVQIGDNAFSLVNREDNGAVDVAVTSSTVDGNTVATLSFSGQYAEEPSGSLVDGNYRLTIDGNNITDAQGNNYDVDGDGSPGGVMVLGDQADDNFYRLFGDINSDRRVTFTDFIGFRTVFLLVAGDPLFEEGFDADDSGSITFTDFLRFRDNFLSELLFQ